MAEIQPPAEIWSRISKELDAAREKGFVQKLAGAEIVPPATAWENIQSRLSGNEPRVVPMRSKLMRYTVAAIAVGVLAVAAFFLFDSNKQASGIVSTEQNDTNSVANNTEAANGSTEIVTPENVGVAEVTSAEKREAPASRLARRRASVRPSSVRYASVEPVQTKNTVEFISQTTQGVNENIPSGMKASIPPPEYYTIQAPNGQPVKIAARFSGAVNYLFNADDKTDNSSWKAKLDNWRNKLMSNPSFIPTASNFLDILELREMMKDQ